MTRRLAACCTLAVLASGAGNARADYIDHMGTLSDVGMMKVPHRGPTRVLVLPVIIDDQPFLGAYTTQAAWLNHVQEFYTSDTGFSFANYYRTASVGRFEPTPVVAPAIHFASCPQLGSYNDCLIPRGGGISNGDIVGAVALLQDVLRFLDEIITCGLNGPGGSRTCTTGGPISLASVDNSGPVEGIPDGWADGIIIVSNARFPGIALPVKDLSQNPLLIFTFPPLPSFQYSGVQVGAVAISGGARGTFVSTHEFGHLLGWADLYNESGSTTDMPYSLMGGWYYSTPASLPDAFSRSVAGWSHLTQVSGPTTLFIPPADVSGRVYKVGTGDEFFMLEYRTQGTVTDGDMSVASGVLVERVRLSKMPNTQRGRYLGTLANCVNCSAWDPLLLMEQADGLQHLQLGQARNDDQDMYMPGDMIEPSSDTAARNASHLVYSTNLLSGASTGITVRVVAMDSSGATVEVDTPAVSQPCVELGWLCRESTCVQDTCGGPPTAADGGVPDAAGMADAAVVMVDSGVQPADAGRADAAVGRADAAAVVDSGALAADAGTPDVDAGSTALDAGLSEDDAGAPDSGADADAGEGASDSGAIQSGADGSIQVGGGNDNDNAPAAGGCACATATGLPPELALLGLLPFWFNRKRHLKL